MQTPNIKEHRTPLEIATEALLEIVKTCTPNAGLVTTHDMVFIAAAALAKAEVPLPNETPPAVIAFYEEAKK